MTEFRLLHLEDDSDVGGSKSHHLRQYDPAYLPYYLSQHVVVSRWRFALIHLAIERQWRAPRPLLVLDTGGPHMTQLVSGRVCDVLNATRGQREDDPFEYRAWFQTGAPEWEARYEALQAEELRVHAPAFVSYMGYLARNHHGSSPWNDDDPCAIDLAIDKYTKYLSRYLGGRGEMIVRPVFPITQLNLGTSGGRTCFVIMPFEERLTRFYRDVILPVLEASSVKSARTDDFYTVGAIVDDIWRRICECDFVLADLTGRNPNVFYELGIAHTLGKRVILLCQNISDVPFDLRHHRLINYSTEYDQVDRFRQELKSTVENVCDGLPQPAEPSLLR